MGPVEALKLALSKEIEAIGIYEKLSIDAPAAKDVLLFLANEEQRHKKLIEQKIKDLTNT